MNQSSTNDYSASEGSDLNRQYVENLPPVLYNTWASANGKTAGLVAVYHDETGTYAKIVHNGVVRCYEQIAPPEQAGIR